MKAGTFLATAFLAVATMMTPFQASAMSVKQYETETKQQRADFVGNEIDEIIANVAMSNPALSKAIHDYFYVIPEGQPESPGLIAFAGALAAVEDSAGQGKLDLDKVQIEGILLGIIKRDVIPQFSTTAPPSPAQQ